MDFRLGLFVLQSVLVSAIVLPNGGMSPVDAADSTDEYEQVVNGFLLGRQNLKTGVAQYRGKFHYVIESDQRHRDCEIKGLYAFDFAESLLRIEESFQTMEADGTPVTDAVKGFQLAIQEKKMLLKYPEDETPRQIINIKRELPEFVTKFDLRVLAASHSVGWDRMTLKDLAEIFDRQGQDVTEVVRENDCVRVTWVFRANDRPAFRRTIWFRVDRDYCPEKIEVCLPKPIVVPENDRFEWNEPSQSQQLEVVQFRGQWVPKKVVIINEKRKRELEFQWKSLNEPLDEKTFELDFDVDQNE